MWLPLGLAGALLSGRKPKYCCNVGWFIPLILISIDSIDTCQFVCWWLQWTKRQWGGKETGENRSKDEAYLENISAWCDELTHWQDICLYQTGPQLYLYCSPLVPARRALLVKSLKSCAQTWEWVMWHSDVPAGCWGTILDFFYCLKRESF